MTLNRGKQWATKCKTCDKEIQMGPGSKAYDGLYTIALPGWARRQIEEDLT